MITVVTYIDICDFADKYQMQTIWESKLQFHSSAHKKLCGLHFFGHQFHEVLVRHSECTCRVVNASFVDLLVGRVNAPFVRLAIFGQFKLKCRSAVVLKFLITDHLGHGREEFVA